MLCSHSHTVDSINPALPLRTLNYEIYGIFLIITGNAGFISSTVLATLSSASLF